MPHWEVYAVLDKLLASSQKTKMSKDQTIRKEGSANSHQAAAGDRAERRGLNKHALDTTKTVSRNLAQ